MKSNETKEMMKTFIEAADDNLIERIFFLVRNYLNCPEHQQGEIQALVAMTAAKFEAEEELIPQTPPKYRGKHEDLVEKIAQEERDETIAEMMEEVRALEKTRRC